MKTAFRRALALMLVLLSFASLASAAQAANWKYPEDQVFVEGEGGSGGYAVNVSATNSYDGAVARRDSMLSQGYDSFIYCKGDQYRVMCGKFRVTEYDLAVRYLNHILEHSDRKDAYITNVDLPDWAYSEFWDIYRRDPFNTGEQDSRNGEAFNGPFFDGDRKDGSRRVYTVQVSAGKNSAGQLTRRDQLIAQGFDAFVYQIDGVYRTMSGMFDEYEAAKARCDAIIRYTEEDDAYVTEADIPADSVIIREYADPEKYYGAYAELLKEDNWARTYLPKEQVNRLTDGTEPLRYTYSVMDVDGNGVDELLVMEVKTDSYGVWALFSCDSKGSPYLIAWNNTHGTPLVSLCREKGILAFQGWLDGEGSCELRCVKDGKPFGSDQLFRAADAGELVLPTDVDSKAEGYYVELLPIPITELVRLNGEEA